MGMGGVGGTGPLAGFQKPRSGAPDLEAMENVGRDLDEKFKQLERMIAAAIANQGNPEAMRALLAQLQQAVNDLPSQDNGVGGVSGSGQAGGAASADPDRASRLEELKRQLDALSQAGALDAASRGSAQSPQATASPLGVDQNLVKPRDISAMY